MRKKIPYQYFFEYFISFSVLYIFILRMFIALQNLLQFIALSNFWAVTIHLGTFFFSIYLLKHFYKVTHCLFLLQYGVWMLLDFLSLQSGCTRCAMEIVFELKTWEKSSNSSRVRYIQLRTNTIRNSMNPSPSASYGLNSRTYLKKIIAFLEKLLCSTHCSQNKKKIVFLTTENVRVLNNLKRSR